MNIDYLYRNAGIRNLSDFSKPPLTNVTDLRIPKDSIIHIMPQNSGDYGPLPIEALLFELIKKKSNIFIRHLERFKSLEFDPRSIHINLSRIISDYHRKNRMFRLLRNEQLVLTNNNAVLAVNYCILPHLLRFNKSIYADYYLQKNIFNMLNETIANYKKISNRVQFVECEIPSKVKTLAEYERILSKKYTQTIDELDISEYWLLGLLNYLDEDSNEDYNFVNDNENIVFYWNINNRLIFLSMQMLNLLKEKNIKELQRALVNLNVALLEESNKNISELANVEDLEKDIDEPLDSEIKRLAEKMANEGFISENEKERMIRLSEKYKDIKNPIGEGNLTDLTGEVSTEESQIDNVELVDLPTMADKSMTKSTVEEFDRKYIAEIYQKDIANMVLNMQRAGIAITNFQIEEDNDAATNSYLYKIQFTPIDGSPSTITFRLPKLEEDGTFMANNVKCRLDKQRTDMPIRKIKTNSVTLTSYFGKLFVDRDSKSVNDYARWITNKLMSISEEENSPIKKITVGNVFDHNIKTPRVYSAIAGKIEGFNYKNMIFNFNYHEREKLIGNKSLSSIEKRTKIVCGKTGEGVISVDFKNNFYLTTDKEVKSLGTINNIFDNKLGKGPMELATIVIMGKGISIGLMLSYRYGLTNLLRKLKVKYKIDRSKRAVIQEDQFIIKFSDFNLIIDDSDPKANLVLAGLNMYKKDLVNYKYGDFDHKDVYFNIFNGQGMTIRYLKEIDLIFQMFIDPITLELLKEIKEPTSVDGLLMRAVELLIIDEHPKETDMAYMRIRGYERLAGMVYNELIKSLRGYINSPEGKQRKIDLNPRAVWLNVVKDDPSQTQVNETNPIQNLKEKEKVSYSGIGGRDNRTMVRRTREFHPNDQGVISEATTDNGKAGVITYLTADPSLVNVRGVTKKIDSDVGVARQVSTTFLLSPCSDRDEGKRVNFASIQYAHTVAVEGNQVQPIRTGYENVIAHRADKIYASVAKLDGVIDRVSDNALSVIYENDETEKLLLGKQIAKTPGMNIVHELITDRKAGYRFIKGEVLCFNKGFFKRDLFNPRQVCFLMGAMARVALLEGTDTLEDSCSISQRLSGALATKRTQVRNIIVNFDQSIHSLVKVGDPVETDTVLCIINDNIVSNNTSFDEKTLQSLDILAANAPKAKYKGYIESIEMLYYGKMEDMNEPLRELAQVFNKQKKKKVEELGTVGVKNNELKDSILIDKNKLSKNSAVLKIYISNKEEMGIGDKGVFCNQLKTIVGRVMTGVNETESGLPIDAIFGFQSIANRVVLSPQITGTTSGALKVLGKKAAEIFFT